MAKQKSKNSNTKLYLKHKYCIINLLLLSSLCLFLLFKLIALHTAITQAKNKSVRRVFEISLYGSCYKKLNKLNGNKNQKHSDYCLCIAKKMGDIINWDTETFIDYPNIDYSNKIYASKLLQKYKKDCMEKVKMKK